MRYTYKVVFLTALIGGIYLAVMYVNPYNGTIMLSELVLQLSGSRGQFALGFSFQELTTFALRMIPIYVFEAYFGIAFYRHFCTASIYVFSRQPRRVRWYIREIFVLGCYTLLFHVLLLVAVILTTLCRYGIQTDVAGIALLLYHCFLYFLWNWTMTTLVNLLAIWWGSSTSYAVVLGVQVVCISLLMCENLAEKYFDASTYSEGLLLRLNPMAHLVIGWHSSRQEVLDRVLDSPYMKTDLGQSLFVCMVACVAVFAIGAVIVKRHDLLISDSETEA